MPIILTTANGRGNLALVSPSAANTVAMRDFPAALALERAAAAGRFGHRSL